MKKSLKISRRKRLRRIGLLGVGAIAAGLSSGAESPRRGLVQPQPAIQQPTIQLAALSSAHVPGTISIGGGNGTELLGSIIAGVLCLRSARHRQWI